MFPIAQTVWMFDCWKVDHGVSSTMTGHRQPYA